jgi:hypothetical protein
MGSTRVMRTAGAAGVAASVLVFGGLYLSSQGFSGLPANDADAASWAAWARSEELPVEIGVYLLLVPGLLLFLWEFAALRSLLSEGAVSARLASYGAVMFAVLFAAAGVVSSTASSTGGYFPGFDDPSAVTVLTGITAGFHLQYVGIWALAVTMVATSAGLRRSMAISSRLHVGSIALAVLAVAGSLVGFGVIFAIIWMLAVGIGLLRISTIRRGREAA